MLAPWSMLSGMYIHLQYVQKSDRLIYFKVICEFAAAPKVCICSSTYNILLKSVVIFIYIAALLCHYNYHCYNYHSHSIKGTPTWLQHIILFEINHANEPNISHLQTVIISIFHPTKWCVWFWIIPIKYVHFCTCDISQLGWNPGLLENLIKIVYWQGTFQVSNHIGLLTAYGFKNLNQNWAAKGLMGQQLAIWTNVRLSSIGPVPFTWRQ